MDKLVTSDDVCRNAAASGSIGRGERIFLFLRTL